MLKEGKELKGHIVTLCRKEYNDKGKIILDNG